MSDDALVRDRREPAGDAPLWARVRADDPAAFVEVFEQYGTQVYNALYRRTGSWSDAEDLTGAVFLVAWERRGTRLAGGDDALLPWLLRIAINVGNNAQRSRRRYEAALARLPVEHEPDPAAQVADRVDAATEISHLTPVLDQLPLEQRQAVQALADSGDQATAARTTGVSSGTFTSRLSRARRALRANDPDQRSRKEQT